MNSMTSSRYLSEVCAANVADLAKEPSSIRYAWNAAVALFHFADYLAADRTARSGTVISTRAAIEELIRGFPRFQAVRDVANANKHFRLDRKSPRRGLSMLDLRAGPGAAFTDGTYFDDGSSFDDQEDVVRIEFNGEIIDVVQLCEDCLGYLQKLSV